MKDAIGWIISGVLIVGAITNLGVFGLILAPFIFIGVIALLS